MYLYAYMQSIGLFTRLIEQMATATESYLECDSIIGENPFFKIIDLFIVSGGYRRPLSRTLYIGVQYLESGLFCK